MCFKAICTIFAPFGGSSNQKWWLLLKLGFCHIPNSAKLGIWQNPNLTKIRHFLHQVGAKRCKHVAKWRKTHLYTIFQPTPAPQVPKILKMASGQVPKTGFPKPWYFEDLEGSFITKKNPVPYGTPWGGVPYKSLPLSLGWTTVGEERMTEWSWIAVQYCSLDGANARSRSQESQMWA